MNILVTGISGFIGSNLVNNLILNNYNVFGITRNKSSISKNVINNINVLEIDITSNNSIIFLNNILKKEKIECIIHLAASLKYFGSKKILFKTNTLSTINLLKLAFQNNVGKFIFPSSIEAIGPRTSKVLPVDESENPSPISEYGKSKLLAEKRIYELINEKRDVNTNAVVLRLGNVYGPGSKFLIPAIAESIKAKSILFKYLSFFGDNIYNPIFIDDVIRAINICIKKNMHSFQIYNICGKEYVRIYDIFEKIAKLLNENIEQKSLSFFDMNYLRIRNKIIKFFNVCDTITYLTYNNGLGSNNRAFKIDKAKKDLDFEPNVSIGEGIRRTLKIMG